MDKQKLIYILRSAMGGTQVELTPEEVREATMETARVALAALEAEPAAATAQDQLDLLSGPYDVDMWGLQHQGEGDILLYTVPPVPVATDALEMFAQYMANESIKAGDYPEGWRCKASNAAQEYLEQYRNEKDNK